MSVPLWAGEIAKGAFGYTPESGIDFRILLRLAEAINQASHSVGTAAEKRFCDAISRIEVVDRRVAIHWKRRPLHFEAEELTQSLDVNNGHAFDRHFEHFYDEVPLDVEELER